MKHSFSSVLVLAILFHLPCLVFGAPFTWRNRHAYYARSVEANATTTTTLAKGEATAFVNSTTIAEKKATATKTQAESTASTTIIKGKSPLQTALLPRITDWNSCQGFLSNSGINLFVNQIDLNFDVVINQVTVFEILIDNRGRARETRVRHAFPQPTNYYAEFDKGNNKGGNNQAGNNQAGNNKGNKGNNGKATVTATATAVTETAGKAKETASTTAEETASTTASTAEETATATEAAKKAQETASTTTTTAKAKETTTTAAAESTASSEAGSKETATAQATALY